jgi:hypothetical protein
VFDGALEDGERAEGGDRGVHGKPVFTFQGAEHGTGIVWQVEDCQLLLL